MVVSDGCLDLGQLEVALPSLLISPRFRLQRTEVVSAIHVPFLFVVVMILLDLVCEDPLNRIAHSQLLFVVAGDVIRLGLAEVV